MKSTLVYIFLLASSFAYAQDTLNPHPINCICPFHAINLKGEFKLYIGDTIGDRRTMRLIWYGMDTIMRSVDLKASNAELGWVAADDDDFFALYSTSSVQYTSRVHRRPSAACKKNCWA